MKATLLKYLDRLRASFWFLPTLMAFGAVVFAFFTVWLDETVTSGRLKSMDWIYSGGAEGASAVLQTIAGSMITIAGVVFSLTLVALSLASQQFGPRMLRNFMRDTTNQLVLGTFVATFLYCLLVLRTIRRADDALFVPHLSVTLGVIFALASLWVLIFFIHHVSVSIQADEIVARVGKELRLTIQRHFPQELNRDGEADVPAAIPGDLPPNFEQEALVVAADEDGYMHYVDADALLALAEEHDAVIRMERRPGHYVVAGTPLARVWPPDRVADDIADKINGALVFGNQRTPGQDIEFSVQQLVEIAVRALSPGINDPFTAITCIDRLGSALYCLAGRELPSPYRLDEQQRLRLVLPQMTFAGVADAAFNQIRQHAHSSVAVTIRLLEAVAVVASTTCRDEDRAVLQRHADMVVRGARADLAERNDLAVVTERYDTVSKELVEAARPRRH
ncbi:MAG: DUF2254 domain-containing protein [Steroidobacteraceae bacterium]